jgi:hypothetical protein
VSCSHPPIKFGLALLCCVLCCVLCCALLLCSQICTLPIAIQICVDAMQMSLGDPSVELTLKTYDEFEAWAATCDTAILAKGEMKNTQSPWHSERGYVQGEWTGVKKGLSNFVVFGVVQGSEYVLAIGATVALPWPEVMSATMLKRGAKFDTSGSKYFPLHKDLIQQEDGVRKIMRILCGGLWIKLKMLVFAR